MFYENNHMAILKLFFPTQVNIAVYQTRRIQHTKILSGLSKISFLRI